MNEENTNLTENNENEWQAPPLPEEILREEKEQPQMSEVGTLGSIFIEPGKTFEDLRRKPRFILAGLIMIIVLSVFQFLFIQKIGYEQIVRNRIEQSPQVQQMDEAAKQKIIEQQTKPLFEYIGYATLPIGMILFFLVGGLIYWLGAMAFGGNARFTHGISAWIYSSFPPILISTIMNIIVLMIKSADEIDIGSSQRGLIHANPSFFIDGKEMPVLATLLSSLDLFTIWGWILAAIGLRFVAKLSSSSAWTIVLIVALIGITLRVVMALAFGAAM